MKYSVPIYHSDMLIPSGSNINFSPNRYSKMGVLSTYLSEDIFEGGLKRKSHKTSVSRFLLGGAK